jgi:hypothetical protein
MKRTWFAFSLATAVVLTTMMCLPAAAYGQTAGATGDAFSDLVRVPYSSRRLSHLQAVFPTGHVEVGDLVWARQTPGHPARLYFLGELRIVNWNAAGHGRNKHRPAAGFFPYDGIAGDILRQVDHFDANVTMYSRWNRTSSLTPSSRESTGPTTKCC